MFHVPCFRKDEGGFTIFELLISMAILALLLGASVVFFGGFARERELSEESKKLADYLKFAQVKAQNQESGSNWGVHVENPESGRPWYGLFQGGAYPGSASATIYVSKRLDLFSPSDGTSTDIIFEAPLGRPVSDATITVMMINNPLETKFVIIKSTGLIYGE